MKDAAGNNVTFPVPLMIWATDTDGGEPTDNNAEFRPDQVTSITGIHLEEYITNICHAVMTDANGVIAGDGEGSEEAFIAVSCGGRTFYSAGFFIVTD